MRYRVPFIRPSFPSAKELAEDYDQIVESNWFTNFGPFERNFAYRAGQYIGPEYTAVTFSSATAGLFASILAVLGRGDGSKYVIMPSFTFVAGADALTWCGYKPLLVDIEDKGLHMDIKEAEKLLKERPDKIAGILFCNAFGVGTTNIDAWEALSEQHKKPLIIDSAAGFGSLYASKRKVGSAGTCEIFSFHATKSFAIGEGGAVVTKDKQLAEALVQIQNFGFGAGRTASRLGFNGKLQEINAAIGIRQLARFDEIIAVRQSIFNKYKAELNPHLYTLQENAEQASLCFATVIVKDANKRDLYLNALHEAGIEAKTYYNPSIHKQPYFKDADRSGALPVTERIDNSVLSLPVYDALAPDDVNLIIDTLNTPKELAQ